MSISSDLFPALSIFSDFGKQTSTNMSVVENLLFANVSLSNLDKLLVVVKEK